MSKKLIWTSAITEAVRVWWSNGLTVPQIANAMKRDFGIDATASMVTGKITREGFTRSPDLFERLTAKLVQQEIDKACAINHADPCNVIFRTTYKDRELPQTIAARIEAIEGIICRTGASGKAIADVWGCEDTFILPHYPDSARLAFLRGSEDDC